MEDPKSRQTVYVVDDDDAVRDAVTMLLDTMEISNATYASADEFLQAFSPDMHGCLVLDIRMPGMSGLDLQEQLRAREANIPIVFITGHGDVPMAVEAMKRGAVDFIRKPFRDQELLDRINDAFNLEAEERSDRANVDAVRKCLGSLTPRELEVFERVAAGQANKVIAIELEISERTVEIHRSQVMRKMQARTLADLVRMKVVLERAGA